MTIVRVGTTKKYSDGWEAAFGKGKKKSKAAPKKASGKSQAKPASAKKSAKKRPATKAGKKKSGKK